LVDPATRERAVIALLEEWPWDLGATLIGGYAISAYGAPRYSDDVDLVIPDAARPATEAWLKKRGFDDALGRKTKASRVFRDAPRFSRDEVTLDVLAGYVRDREAKVAVPESWISLRPRLERLELLSGRTQRKIPVARPEALWALKLQAGREQDLTDLFTMADVPVEAEEVRLLFESLMVPSLAVKLQAAESKLRDGKIYNDSRSRMGLKNTEAVMARWAAFRERVSAMIPPRRTTGSD